MRRLTCVKTVAASLLFGAAAVAWGAATPVVVSSAKTPASASTDQGIIAFATTAPNPKSAYVVAAGLISNTDLEVLAWMDPFSSLKQVPNPGVDEGNIPASVAATGLDPSRVVTADFDADGILHIDTWTVSNTGVVKQNGASTPPNAFVTNNPSVVEITTVSSTEVVVAFQNSNSTLEVEAWTIAANGLPTPVNQYGAGITLGGSFSITTLNAGEVLTAAVDVNSDLWVSTWGVNSAGITSAPQSQVMSTGSWVDGYPFSSGPVSIAAGNELESVTIAEGIHIIEPVPSAFTPIVNTANIEVVDWGISGADILSQTNTPSLSTVTIYVPHLGPACCRKAFGSPLSEINMDMRTPGCMVPASLTTTTLTLATPTPSIIPSRPSQPSPQAPITPISIYLRLGMLISCWGCWITTTTPPPAREIICRLQCSRTRCSQSYPLFYEGALSLCLRGN